ncbi:MAG: PA2169 family four-helix-bundle protein [Acidobacteriaceae bacterium]|nr:PA2169 family four-helix-bundle protein [Acidobacteriaceae bacterium]
MAEQQSWSAVSAVIAICRDAEQGFRSAANAVNDANLKTIFEQYSAQRTRFTEELRVTVERAGGTVTDSSGVLGKVHAGWIALKGALTGHSEHQILEETERGEDLSLKRYHEALQYQELPSEVRSLLQQQHSEVEAAHSRIKGLRDAAARATSAG